MWHGKRFEVVSGQNCPGKDCGAKGTEADLLDYAPWMVARAESVCVPPLPGIIFNLMGAGPIQWENMPGITYIGHFRDVDPALKGKCGRHPRRPPSTCSALSGPHGVVPCLQVWRSMTSSV